MRLCCVFVKRSCFAVMGALCVSFSGRAYNIKALVEWLIVIPFLIC